MTARKRRGLPKGLPQGSLPPKPPAKPAANEKRLPIKQATAERLLELDRSVLAARQRAQAINDEAVRRFYDVVNTLISEAGLDPAKVAVQMVTTEEPYQLVVTVAE